MSKYIKTIKKMQEFSDQYDLEIQLLEAFYDVECLRKILKLSNHEWFSSQQRKINSRDKYYKNNHFQCFITQDEKREYLELCDEVYRYLSNTIVMTKVFLHHNMMFSMNNLYWIREVYINSIISLLGHLIKSDALNSMKYLLLKTREYNMISKNRRTGRTTQLMLTALSEALTKPHNNIVVFVCHNSHMANYVNTEFRIMINEIEKYLKDEGILAKDKSLPGNHITASSTRKPLTNLHVVSKTECQNNISRGYYRGYNVDPKFIYDHLFDELDIIEWYRNTDKYTL